MNYPKYAPAQMSQVERLDLFAAKCASCGSNVDPYTEAKYYCKTCLGHFCMGCADWHDCVQFAGKF